MSQTLPKLDELYKAFLAKRLAVGQTSYPEFEQKNIRCIARLANMGVITVPELLLALPNLPPKLKDFGIWWIQCTKPSGAEPVLLRMLHDDPNYRLLSAHALGMIQGKRTIRRFVQIGRTELASAVPDVRWLEAVIPGIKWADQPEATELLVTIYERTDLPGWLRGDAGDALGCAAKISDRRTRVFHRVWKGALKGLDDSDIEVQFWSMYVIMQLAQCHSKNRSVLANRLFEPALGRLHEIAATDHRLAPGFWWPMCEEAKDAIDCIETGNGRELDAAQRCLGTKQRGECVKRY